MRPKLITPRNLILLLLAVAVFGGLARWGSLGFPLPGQSVPSTAGKLAFVTEQDGKSNIALLDPATSTVSPLTTDGLANEEPAFTPDGSVLFFTGDRGGTRQIVATDATPGRTVVALTRTTSTKQQPQARPDGRVYFVDGGKVSATTRDATDPKAIFPSAEAMNRNPYLKALFREGGISVMAVSSDEKMIALTINREEGQLLVVYAAGEEEESGHNHDHEHEHGGVVLVLGIAEKVIPQFSSDGSLVALFIGGEPLPKAVQIPTPSEAELQQLQADMRDIELPPMHTSEGKNALVRFNNEMAPADGGLLPAAPKELVLAPDKPLVAIAGDAKDGQQGLILLAMGEAQVAPVKLFDKPCQDISWSPDSSQIAFSDGTDIYVVPSDGSSPAKNITEGKAGKATHPVWSPALLKK
ncbi:MAG: hypothetical protein QM758_18860 [Armatimonas sp.]